MVRFCITSTFWEFSSLLHTHLHQHWRSFIILSTVYNGFFSPYLRWLKLESCLHLTQNLRMLYFNVLQTGWVRHMHASEGTWCGVMPPAPLSCDIIHCRFSHWLEQIFWTCTLLKETFLLLWGVSTVVWTYPNHSSLLKVCNTANNRKLENISYITLFVMKL